MGRNGWSWLVLIGLAASGACGRVPLDLAEVPTGADGVVAAGGQGVGGQGGGLGRVPEQHRPSSICTPVDLTATRPDDCRSSGPPPPALNGCSSDADCAGVHARCVQPPHGAPCSCVQDACGSDADCPAGQACACNSVEFGNVCVLATCRVDTDCGAGGFCGPIIAPCTREIVGYQCHSSRDRCLADIDCPIVDSCDAWPDQPWACRVPVACN
jgi:hypothetical protein